MKNSAKTPKSRVFWDFAKEAPRKTSPKIRPNLGAWRTPSQKCSYLINKTHLKCKPSRTFCVKPRLQRCPQSRVLANFAKTPKSPVFWDFSNGGQGQTCPKSRQALGAWKTPWRKWTYLVISMRLKCKPCRTFCAKPRLQRCPQSRVLANFAKTPKSPVFWDFSNGGPRQTGPKSRPTLGAWKTPWRKWTYLIISMRLECNPWKTFCAKLRLQTWKQSRVMTKSAKALKSPVF